MKTIDEIRRNNLDLAILRCNTASELAERAGISAAYISQIKTSQPDSKTGKVKTMGDGTARKIERALNEPPGWMDSSHGEGDKSSGAGLRVVRQQQAEDEGSVSVDEIIELLALYQQASERGRGSILELARSAAKKGPIKWIKSARNKG